MFLTLWYGEGIVTPKHISLAALCPFLHLQDIVGKVILFWSDNTWELQNLMVHWSLWSTPKSPTPSWTVSVSPNCDTTATSFMYL